MSLLPRRPVSAKPSIAVLPEAYAGPQIKVRINAQLIDASTGFQVWADDFRGELQDTFALQEQTALKIATDLNLKLSAEEERAVEHLSRGP